MEFFAVFIPPKNDNDENQNLENVFTDKIDALQLLKRHKDARLKAFKSRDEAEQFCLAGATISSITGLKSPSSLPIPSEKSIHRSLSPQELVLFRKEIEQNHLSDVYQMVMENPRYLVNIAASMPTILKEGPRYNALHVAILSKHFNMCKLILQTIEKPQFIQMLNGPQNEMSTQEASMILLESYLNMPNKPRQETPLHFAAKLGLKDIIELLLSYPLCKQKFNSEGCLPKDVICQRAPDGTPELKKAIAELLQEKFFVPVIRSTDNSTPPTIGEPFSGPNLPNIEGESCLSPKMEVVALAGPMDKDQAQKFRRRWKTPPRVNTSIKSPDSPMAASPGGMSPIKRNNNNSIMSTPRRRRLFEDQNGNQTTEVEHLTPAAKFFREYRNDPNDSFISNTSTLSFEDLDSPAVKERNVRLRDPDKGVETVGRELAKNSSVGWKEYWKFLDRFVDLSSAEGLEMLEKFLSRAEEPQLQREESFSALVDKFNTLNLNRETSTPRSRSLDSFRLRTPDLRTPQKAAASKNITNPHLSIEKALQVYAKRASYNLTKSANVTLTLETELTKLNTIVLSYCEDERFVSVNFKRAHARYACLIRNHIENQNILQTLTAGPHLSEEVNCVIAKLKQTSTSSQSVSTETECIAAWNLETDCECQIKRDQRKKNHRRDFRPLFNVPLWDAREPVETEDDDLEYFSCDSELEYSDASEGSCYETPPESPTDFESISTDDDEWVESEDDVDDGYSNYIKGFKPTKADIDVLNAIEHVSIDENMYPNVLKWKEAVHRHISSRKSNAFITSF